MLRRPRRSHLFQVDPPSASRVEAMSSRSPKSMSDSSTSSEKGSSTSSELLTVWQRAAMKMEYRILTKPRRARVFVVGFARLLDLTRDYFC
jgi:hypothetical protein